MVTLGKIKRSKNCVMKSGLQILRLSLSFNKDEKCREINKIQSSTLN